LVITISTLKEGEEELKNLWVLSDMILLSWL